MRRLALVGLALAVAVVPAAAAAHAAGGGFVLLLPTGYYLAGAGAAVAVSFAILALAPGPPGGLAGQVRLRLPMPPPGAVRWLAFAAFAALAAAGLLGPTDPLENPLPPTLWTVWWVGLTALTAIVGDLWPVLNPFSAPVGLLQRAVGRPPLRLPRAVGYWPALAGLFGFVWFEVVSLAPLDPRRLATAAALYWLAQVAAMLAFGERRWRARGETFSVFFRLIGRVAPLHWTGRGVTLSWPGARLVRGPTLPLSGGLFVTSLIASVSFDGLSATFAWLAFLGINPLDFPGRSAVVAPNTFGLAVAWVAAAALYVGAIAAGQALVSPGFGAPCGATAVQPTTRRSLGRIGPSLVPIALAYHVAHYLTALLVNGQYALTTYAEAFGFPHRDVTTSFLNDFHAVETIWRVQTGIVVAGHVLAVAVAHGVALELTGAPRRAALSQLPLAALMVGLTVLALWLLSAPTGA